MDAGGTGRKTQITRTDTDGKEASEDGGQAKAVAVVFIDGVGVQDRYQQLTAFSNGLTETPTPHFTVTTRTAADGRNLPRGGLCRCALRASAWAARSA